MSQKPGTLRVVRSAEIAEGTHQVEIERADGGAFDFVGGQYVIVNTGVSLANGKPAKRAYSLLPAPGAPGRCRFTVKRLGPGSTALAEATAGTELAFSGPWGKLVSDEDAGERTLFVATDTGITAALGAVEHSVRSVDRTHVLWLRSDDETFLDAEAVARRVETTGARFSLAPLPALDAADRFAKAVVAVTAFVRTADPALILAAGDGAVVHPLRDVLRALPVRDVRIECFFRNPERKAS